MTEIKGGGQEIEKDGMEKKERMEEMGGTAQNTEEDDFAFFI